MINVHIAILNERRLGSGSAGASGALRFDKLWPSSNGARMTWPPSNEIQPPADSRPLSVDELLPEQARSLREAQQALWSIVQQNETALKTKDIQDDAPFARPDASRSPRVLLIDGGRGTGKSSLMLTLLDRLSAHRPNASKGAKARRDADEAAYATKKNADTPEEEKRVEEARSRSIYSEGVAKRVLCMPPLDFDPMPPSVPIVAWLLESLRGLVEAVHNNRLESCVSLASLQRGERVERDLRRGWSELIDAAVAAWENGPDSGQTFAQRTDADRRRLETLTGFGRKLNNALNELFAAVEGSASTCVGAGGVVLIPIDDADMQVRRSPELLHALRVLYHPRLVFILTANWRLLEETLGAYYAGQYARLYGGPEFEVRGDATSATWTSQRPGAQRDISKQLLLKTFPPAHHFPQQLLSLSDMLRFGGWGVGTLEARAQLEAHPAISLFRNIWQVSIREFLTQRDHWSTAVTASGLNEPNSTSASHFGSPDHPTPITPGEVTVLATLSSLLTGEVRGHFNSASLSATVLDPLNAVIDITHAFVSPVYSNVKITDAEQDYDATEYNALQGVTVTLGDAEAPVSDPQVVGAWYWLRYVARRFGEADRAKLTVSSWNAAMIAIPTESHASGRPGGSTGWPQPEDVESRLKSEAAALIERNDYRIGDVTPIIGSAPTHCESVDLVHWWLSNLLPNPLGSVESRASDNQTSDSSFTTESTRSIELLAMLGAVPVDEYASVFFLLSGHSGVPKTTKWLIVRGIVNGPMAALFRDDGSSSLTRDQHSDLFDELLRANTRRPVPFRRVNEPVPPEQFVRARLKYGPGGSIISALVRLAERANALYIRPKSLRRDVSLQAIMTTEQTQTRNAAPYWDSNFVRRVPLQPCIAIERLMLDGPPEVTDRIHWAVFGGLRTTGAEWLVDVSTIALDQVWEAEWGQFPTLSAQSDQLNYDGPQVALNLQWLCHDDNPCNAFCRWTITIHQSHSHTQYFAALAATHTDLITGLFGIFSDIANHNSGLSVQVLAVAEGQAGWGCPAYTTYFRSERARQYWPEFVRITRYETPLGDNDEQAGRRAQTAALLIRWFLLNRTLAMIEYGATFEAPSTVGADQAELLQRCLEPLDAQEAGSDDSPKFEAWAAGLLTNVLDLFGDGVARKWKERFPGHAPATSDSPGDSGDHVDADHAARTVASESERPPNNSDGGTPVSVEAHDEPDGLEAVEQNFGETGLKWLNSAPPRPDCCIGRDDAHALMDEVITDLLAHPEKPQWLGIVGIDGIGKTNLVAEYVHKYGSRFGGGILWFTQGVFVSADLLETLEQSARLSKQFHPINASIGLVVVDGKDSLEKAIRSVNVPAGCIGIYVGRGFQPTIKYGGNVFSVPELSMRDSIRLLQRYYTGALPQGPQVEHTDVVRLTGGHPASLITVALAARSSRMSLPVIERDIERRGYATVAASFEKMKLEIGVHPDRPTDFSVYTSSVIPKTLLKAPTTGLIPHTTNSRPPDPRQLGKRNRLILSLNTLNAMRPGPVPTYVLEAFEHVQLEPLLEAKGAHGVTQLRNLTMDVGLSAIDVLLAHFGVSTLPVGKRQPVDVFQVGSTWRKMVEVGVLSVLENRVDGSSYPPSLIAIKDLPPDQFGLTKQVYASDDPQIFGSAFLRHLVAIVLSSMLDTAHEYSELEQAIRPLRAVVRRMVTYDHNEAAPEAGLILATTLARSYRGTNELDAAWDTLSAAQTYVTQALAAHDLDTDPHYAYVAEWAAVAECLGTTVPHAVAPMVSQWSTGDPPSTLSNNHYQLKYDSLWTKLTRGLDHLLPYTVPASASSTTDGIGPKLGEADDAARLDIQGQPTHPAANNEQQPANDLNDVNDAITAATERPK
ncbi:MAG: hypothetical protein JNM72_00395 [Deltaproteobacteria bacterium]|nr:hypothetical protein [Deltaproteobacteria bacterium]